MEDSVSTATLAPTVAQHPPTFSIAHLRQALAELTAEQPERADRLQRAVATVVACDMERFTFRPGWHIQSVREPELYYAVVPFEGSLACSCPDALHRGNPCKHALAVRLYERAERLDAEQAAPPAQPIGYELTAAGFTALGARDDEPMPAA